MRRKPQFKWDVLWCQIIKGKALFLNRTSHDVLRACQGFNRACQGLAVALERAMSLFHVIYYIIIMATIMYIYNSPVDALVIII